MHNASERGINMATVNYINRPTEFEAIKIGTDSSLKVGEISVSYEVFLSLFKERVIDAITKIYGHDVDNEELIRNGIDKELQDEINGIISNENIRVLVERPLIMTIGSFSILRIVNVTNGFNDITLPMGECLSIGFDWDGDMAILSPAPSLK